MRALGELGGEEVTNDVLADQDVADGASGLPDGDDDIQGVVVNEPLDLARALGLNYSVFPNSCLGG